MSTYLPLWYAILINARFGKSEELMRKEREEREIREVLFIRPPVGSYEMNPNNDIFVKRIEREAKERLERKEYKKRSRRSFRPEMTIPDPTLYMSSQPASAPPHPPPTPPPGPVLGFPTPPSPPMVPSSVRLQMHDSNGARVDSSDDDGDDDDDDEFEDSEQTEATATATDVEESITSEGELCATPESGPRGGDKWVAIKGQALPPLSPSPSPSPRLSPVMTVTVHAVPAAAAHP
ncbi:hypothetical protein BJV74DRAFT_533299 [Russula compacta]|nr:hypothetical protein BJV74DRAFT_533299 [Russula compacta]